MNHQELVAGLKKLHLHAIAKDYAEVARICEGEKKTYEQYLAAIVQLELSAKQSTKVKRLINAAGLPRQKTLAAYDFSKREGITRESVNRLALGQFIKDSWNIVLFGSSGLGKSHLAEGLTLALCHHEYRCRFITMPNLIEELVSAQTTLNLANYFRKLDRYDLIAIDELGYSPQKQDGADLFFKLISHRYERRSIMITTNLTYSEWDKVFLNPITTAAAVDRIIHKCETFNITGPSWRAEEALKRQIAAKGTAKEVASSQ
jgi:DNA replication protein DnaC